MRGKSDAAAIGGAVTRGLEAGAGTADGVWAKVLNNEFVQGALSSAITQGIGVATGLQKQFSWAVVAAAGASAYAGAHSNPAGKSAAGAIFARVTASTLANAATRTLLEGSSFGDNIIAALPDVIGQTIGEAIAGGFSQRSSATTSSAKVGSTPSDAADVAAQAGVQPPQVETLDDGTRIVRNVFQLNQDGEGFLRSGYYDEAGVFHPHTDGKGIRFVSDSGSMSAGERYVYETRIPGDGGARVSRLIQLQGEIEGAAFAVYDGAWIEDLGIRVSVGRFEMSASQRAAAAVGQQRVLSAQRADYLASQMALTNEARMAGQRVSVEAAVAVGHIMPVIGTYYAYQEYQRNPNGWNALALGLSVFGDGAMAVSMLRGASVFRGGSAVAATDEMASFTAAGADVVHGSTFTRVGGDAVSVRAAENVRPIDGVHDVVVHGGMYDEAGAVFLVDGAPTHANQIAESILANPSYSGESIRLLTCFGACGPAQELSTLMGVRVQAATSRVGVAPAAGSTPVLQQGGAWYDFFPK